MSHDVINALAALGVFGQVVARLTVLAGLLWLSGLRRQLNAPRRASAPARRRRRLGLPPRLENGVIKQTQACLLSAARPIGSTSSASFTIPTLALIGFALTFVFLGYSALDTSEA